MTTVRQSGSAPPEEAIDADAFNAFEAAGWEDQAPTYDHFFGRTTSRLVDPLLDAAPVGPESRVLDLATGPAGYAAAKATERGASVVGVDIAPAMIRLTRQLHPDIDFRQADAEALPFEDRSFDAVVSNFVVPHLGRPERVVSELVRVLNNGGSLALDHLGRARADADSRVVPRRLHRNRSDTTGRPPRWAPPVSAW